MQAETRVDPFMARRPVGQPARPVEMGHKQGHSARCLDTSSKYGRAMAPVANDVSHGYRVKDTIYTKTLSWLKNLKPWTKSSHSSSYNDKDGASFTSHPEQRRSMKVSKSERNLSTHIENLLAQNSIEDVEPKYARQSSLRNRISHNRYSASFCPDMDYVDPASGAYHGDTSYPSYAAYAMDYNSSISHDYRSRYRGGSFKDRTRSQKKSPETIVNPAHFYHHEPQYHQTQLSKPAAKMSTRSQSSNGLDVRVSREPLGEANDQEEPPMTTTQAAAAVSGSTVTRILREKLFGRAKSSISLDEESQQPSRCMSSSFHATQAGGGLVKLRPKKCKPSDHVYVVNREDKMMRPRSCATLPHDAKLGESMHGRLGFLSLACSQACLY